MSEFFATIYPTITSIGLLAAFIYIVVKEFKSGTDSLEKKTFATYKERNDQLEKEIPRLQSEMKTTREELAKLAGQVEEKDKHIKSLTEIIQGKNPEVIQLLIEMKELNKQIIAFMHTVDDRTSKVLQYQTSMIEGQVKREGKINSGEHSQSK